MGISKRIVGENGGKRRMWRGWRVASAQGMPRCRHPWCCRQGGGKRETSVFTVHYGLASRPNGRSLSSRFAGPPRHVNIKIVSRYSAWTLPFRVLCTTTPPRARYLVKSIGYDEDNYHTETPEARVSLTRITLTILLLLSN